jgi:hypothetical protein
MELAMLWRTLSILRYSSDLPQVLQTFYTGLLDILKDVPALSLSNFASDGGETNNLVGIPDSDCEGPAPSGNDRAHFTVPELAYLHDDDNGAALDEVNDPLGIVQKLLEIAEGAALAVAPEDRGPLLSACLALGVKSGRASLLLQTACLLLLDDGCSADIDNGNECSEHGFENNDDSSTSKSAKGSRARARARFSIQKASETVGYRDVSLDLLQDIVTYVTQRKSVAATSEVCPIGGEDSAQIDKRLTDLLKDKIVTGGVALSFGKADHGKLGHGDTQVGTVTSLVQ